MRLGIIGIRGQAALWARAASRTAGWRVSACYHPRRSRQDPASPHRQTDDLEELLSSSDAVLIGSPTPTHPGYLRLLARRFGGAVLVEKPVAATLEECRNLARALPPSFQKGLVVTHNWRLYPWVQQTKRILDREGEDSVIAADFHLTHDFAHKPAYRRSWRSRRGTHPIGPMETQGIHWIDIAHFLFGPVESVWGRAVNGAGTGTAPDTCSMILRMRSGPLCSIHTSYAAPMAHYGRILSAGSILTYRNGTLWLERRPQRPPPGRSRVPRARILSRQNLESLALETLSYQLRLLAARRDGRAENLPATFFQGIANVAVLSAFHRSLRTGGPIPMSRIPIYARSVRAFAV